MSTVRAGLNAAFAAIALVLAATTAVAQDVKFDYDRSVDSSKYKVYRWVEIAGATHPDQLTDKNIRTVIDAELAKHGFTKVDSGAVDIYVAYQTAVNQEKQVNAYGGGGWRWGGGMGTATVSTINIGTLVVDLYDPAMKQLVWRGSASESLHPSEDADKNYQRLQKAVDKLLKHYPPEKK